MAAAAVVGGRKTDAVVGRVIEAMMALPGLVTALAFASILGASFVNLLFALIVTSWPWYARTYRALLLKERSALYVESAVASGATQWHVLLRHVLPNIVGPAAVLATANFGTVILNLAGLSPIACADLEALRENLSHKGDLVTAQQRIQEPVGIAQEALPLADRQIHDPVEGDVMHGNCGVDVVVLVAIQRVTRFENGPGIE